MQQLGISGYWNSRIMDVEELRRRCHEAKLDGKEEHLCQAFRNSLPVNRKDIGSRHFGAEVCGYYCVQ